MTPGAYNHGPPPEFPTAYQILLTPSQTEYRPRRRLFFGKAAADLVNKGKETKG